MNSTINAQGIEMSPALAAWLDRRVSHALDRFSDRILAVDVSLRDVNGPKGGRDKQVLLKIRLRRGHLIAAESTRSSLYAAISTAARRARRGVKRTIKKSQTRDQRRSQRLSGTAAGVSAS